VSKASDDESIRLVVRVTPKAGHDALEGLTPDANGKPVLKARVAATAEGGKANAQLVALLAKEFGVPKSSVTIVRGATARLKQVRIKATANGLPRACRRSEAARERKDHRRKSNGRQIARAHCRRDRAFEGRARSCSRSRRRAGRQ